MLVLTTDRLDLPGLYYDEAADAVPAMQIVLGQPVELFRGGAVTLFDRQWPLMVMDYVGTISSYLMVPFLSVFGIRTEALRALPVTFGALTLLTGYGFLRGAIGPVAGLIAIWLVAIHPSFIYWTRQGIHVSSIMTVFSTSALWLLLHWRRGGGHWALVLAAFILGLGVWVKILFIWVVVAIGASAVLLSLPIGRYDGPRRRLPFVSWRQFLIPPLAVAAFLAGASPFILYNVQTLGTLTVIQQNAVQTSYGVDNRAFLPNLVTRLDAYAVFLKGDHFWFLGDLFANHWYPPLFLGSLAVLAILLLFSPEARACWRRPVFLVLFIGLIILQSTVTVSGLGPTHFYVLYPFPQAVIGLAIAGLIRNVPEIIRARATMPVLATGCATLLAVIGARDLQIDRQYHARMVETGGYGNHSDSIIDLVDYLVEWRGHQPVAMDWGFRKSVQFLSKGQVNPPELYSFERDTAEALTARLQPYLGRKFTVYLFHDGESTIYDNYRWFADAAKAAGKDVKRELAITQRDGKLLFKAYTAMDPER